MNGNKTLATTGVIAALAAPSAWVGHETFKIGADIVVSGAVEADPKAAYCARNLVEIVRANKTSGEPSVKGTPCAKYGVGGTGVVSSMNEQAFYENVVYTQEDAEAEVQAAGAAGTVVGLGAGVIGGLLLIGRGKKGPIVKEPQVPAPTPESPNKSKNANLRLAVACGVIAAAAIIAVKRG